MSTNSTAGRAPARPDILRVLDESTRGGTHIDELRLLYRLAQESHAPIVEIGTAQGRSTIALSLGTQAGQHQPVYAIDPQEAFIGVLGSEFGPWDRREAFFQFLRFDVAETIRVINLPSLTVVRLWDKPIGLLWIDGDHSVQAVRGDCTQWEKFVLRHGVIALDDTHIEGPRAVADELVASKAYVEIAAVGKVRAFRKL